MQIKQFEIVIRTKKGDPKSKVFRGMQFAPNAILAKAQFWTKVKRRFKTKKAAGELLQCVEVLPKKNSVAKNYQIVCKYRSNTGVHTMVKEFRDVTLRGAVSQCYSDLAAQHRARYFMIEILKTKEVSASQCRRPAVKQFHNPAIKFPIVGAKKRGPASPVAKWRVFLP